MRDERTHAHSCTPSNGPAETQITAAAPPATVPRASQRLNSNQHGLVPYSQYIANMVPDDATRVTERAAFMITSTQARADTANDHVNRFLTYQRNQTKSLRGAPPT